MPPTLETDRLLLQPLSLAHSRGMFELWSSPQVCRYSGDAHDLRGERIQLPAETPEDSDKIIEFFRHRAAEGTGFRWALILRERGVFAGAAGFNALGQCAELAYHLHPAHWGSGIMSEACRSALAWVADQGSIEVDAFVEPENQDSIRLIQRLGFDRTGESNDGANRYLLQLRRSQGSMR